MNKSIATAVRPQSKRKQIGLRVKSEKSDAWERLPFVGKDHGGTLTCWDVPLTGGYFGGIEVGKIVARMYFKYLRDHQKDPILFGSIHLRGIIEALNAKVPATEEEAQSLKGQKVGFMSEIGYWLESASREIGACLDAIPERAFVQQANESLDKTDASLMEKLNARVGK